MKKLLFKSIFIYLLSLFFSLILSNNQFQKNSSIFSSAYASSTIKADFNFKHEKINPSDKHTYKKQLRRQFKEMFKKSDLPIGVKILLTVASLIGAIFIFYLFGVLGVIVGLTDAFNGGDGFLGVFLIIFGLLVAVGLFILSMIKIYGGDNKRTRSEHHRRL
jgi:hypothetical protein